MGIDGAVRSEDSKFSEDLFRRPRQATCREMFEARSKNVTVVVIVD